MTQTTATTIDHPAAPKRALIIGNQPVFDWRILSAPKPRRKMEAGR